MDTGLESAMQQIIHRVSPGGATKLHTPGAKSAIIPDCLVTSLAGAVAKYCDEHVCVSVCLSTSLSPERHAQSLPTFLCMLPMAVARSSSVSVMKSQGEGAFLSDFLPH